jgi:hypothetical protein
MANWAFAVRAEADVWEHFWSPLPPAPYHDIFALMKSGKMRIEGDLKPLMTHLMYFKLLLALPRQTELRLDAARH